MSGNWSMHATLRALESERDVMTTALVWSSAASLVVASHVSLAIAITSWSKAPISAGAPPASVMIDLAPLPHPQAAEADRPDAASAVEPPSLQTLVSWGISGEIGQAASAFEAQALLNSIPSASVESAVPMPPARPKQTVRTAAKTESNQSASNPEKEPPSNPMSLLQDSAGAPASRNNEAQPTFGLAATTSDLPSDWKSRLLSHLDRHKRYPAAAQSSSLQGTALMNFTIDRNGNVTSYYLARGSGHDDLDREALAMIVRASPVPPLPAEVGGHSVQLLVPIRFHVLR